MGERVPQSIQNIIIRDFCKKNSLHYLLSATEYTMENSFLIFNQLIDELDLIDGIVLYSLFQLPINYEERNQIFNKVINMNKILYFALENYKLSNFSESKKINIIWNIKKTINFCPKKIILNEDYYG